VFGVSHKKAVLHGEGGHGDNESETDRDGSLMELKVYVGAGSDEEVIKEVSDDISIAEDLSLQSQLLRYILRLHCKDMPTAQARKEACKCSPPHPLNFSFFFH
jgi:hypothetical protein